MRITLCLESCVLGYEQVRSVVCALTGDLEGASAVELVLPETGVCSKPGAAGGAEAACCGTAQAAPAAVSSLIALTPAIAIAEPAAKETCCGAAPSATCDCQ